MTKPPTYKTLKYPNIKQELHETVRKLSEDLKRSTARWKIVFAHHPLYTKGRGHNMEAQTLKRAYHLEEVLVEGGAHAYFAGHEHVLQHHCASGVHHFVGGASSRSHFYHGEDKFIEIDWHDTSFSAGFLSVDVFREKLEVVFVEALGGAVIKQVVIPHRDAELPAAEAK
jgi:hypothetical protein